MALVILEQIMARKYEAKENYYELKRLYNEIKDTSRRSKSLDNERFEDVSDSLANSDKEGKVELSSYMDFYLGMRSNRQIKDIVPPAGLKATNSNYCDSKFVKSLDLKEK